MRLASKSLLLAGITVIAGCKSRQSSNSDSNVLASGQKLLPDTYWSCNGVLDAPNATNAVLDFTIRTDSLDKYIYANFFVSGSDNSELPTPGGSMRFDYYPKQSSRTSIQMTTKNNEEIVTASNSALGGTGAEIKATIDLNRRQGDGSYPAIIKGHSGYAGSANGDNIWSVSSKKGQCYPGPMRKK